MRLNTLGFDAHHLKLPPNAVAPNSTTATLTVRSGPQGGMTVFMAYLAIETGVSVKRTPHIIRGNIYKDEDVACNVKLSEESLSPVIVKALPGPIYGVTDVFGNYHIAVDTGTTTYTVSPELNLIQQKSLVSQCSPSYTVSLPSLPKDTCCFDFAYTLKNCVLLNISIQNTRMRRCFRNNTFVNYCNRGYTEATNAQIRVVYPPYLKPIRSVPMWTLKQDSLLIFDISSIPAGDCGSITITDSVICDNESIRGLTQCIKASISPLSDCDPESALWDKSSTSVTGTCSNGNALFTLTNKGSGNMDGNQDYRVYLNDTLIYSGTYELNAGRSLTVSYPAGGNTIRLEADQHSLHPERSLPRATVEGCGAAVIPGDLIGLVTTSIQDDLPEEEAITCNPIIDSYDPNDKQGMPTGTGLTNNILPGQEIEYIIRFQNTGTDLAYTVTIVDTLDINLDEASFTQGSSSHPYTLKVSGKEKAVLTFTFNYINLPAKSLDEAGSNGLVSFRITVPSTIPLGTEIKNKSYIYFDYNSPIITNETIHTVNNAVISDLSRGGLVQENYIITGIKSRSAGSVKIYPNPTEGRITLEVLESGKPGEMRIYSSMGSLQKSIELTNSSKQDINVAGLYQGIYFYEIWQEGERKTGGMLLVK